MYKVVSFDLDEDYQSFRIHFRSWLIEDCWSYIERCEDQRLCVLDRADQPCDEKVTDTGDVQIAYCQISDFRLKEEPPTLGRI